MPAGTTPGATVADSLPGWPRIACALGLALLAEVLDWWVGGSEAGAAAVASQGAGLVAGDVSVWLPWVGMALAAVAIGLTGLSVYRAGLRSVGQMRLGMQALMALAVTGAFLIGEWPEAAMVMALYVAAERIEHQAVRRTRQAIRALLTLTPETADVVMPDGGLRTQAVADVPVGAIVRIAPGARIALDGIVTTGHSSVNQAPITGESTPVDKAPGDSVWAGSINQQAQLHMRVTAAPADSLLARIVHAVEQAQARKAPLQRVVDRFAAVYTPAVMALSAALAVLAPWLLGWTVGDALYRALSLLIIACPCALVLATPVTIVSALTAAARQGVLLKGGSALDQARRLRTVALDKTGTLTTGQPVLVHWQSLPAQGVCAAPTPACAHIVRWAQALAAQSNHPVARAISQGLHLSLSAHAPTPVQRTVPSSGLPASSAQWPVIAGLLAMPGYGIRGTLATGASLSLVNPRWLQERGLLTESTRAAVQAHTAQGHTVSLLVREEAACIATAASAPHAPLPRATSGAVPAAAPTATSATASTATSACSCADACTPVGSAGEAAAGDEVGGRGGVSVSTTCCGTTATPAVPTVLALFAVADTLRPYAREAVRQLQALGVSTVVFSGDHPDAVRTLAAQAGIARAEGGLLPQDKLDRIHTLQTTAGSAPVGMVGDGINDAPALAQADLGFAMGGLHATDIAVETADVVLVHDDLRRIAGTVRLSRHAHSVLWQNIVLAVAAKLGFVALAASGHASMWMAVVADVGISLLVVGNGLRLRRHRMDSAQQP